MTLCGPILRRLVVAAAAAACLALPAVAGAATHQFGTTAPGGGWGCPPADYKYGNEYVLGESGSVTAITAWMRGNAASGSQSFRAMIYAADGPAGAPGTLLATSQTVSVDATAPEGLVTFPIAPAVALTPGSYWIAQQSGGGSALACLSATTSGANAFNADPFADGPSNPFNGSGPISTDANVWTLAATYETAPADTTAPVITASVTPAANANGWHNAPVTVSFSCTDEAGGSGVASVASPVVLAADGAAQSATGTCKDNAGNSSSTTASGINIDQTAPTVSFSGNAHTYTVDQTVALTCSAADALSGVAGSTCANVSAAAYTFGLGTHTVTSSATDEAGNVGNGSTTFTVSVTAGSLCNLTKQFAQASAAYQKLPTRSRATADAFWNAACQAVARVTPSLNASQKRLAVQLYGVAISVMTHGGWLTSGQGAALQSLAAGL